MPDTGYLQDEKDDIMKTKLVLILSALLALMACKSDVVSPPTLTPITIVNPHNGAVLGDPVVIAAVPGEGFAFTRVDFFIDSTLVGSDSIPAYQFEWNIFTEQSGSSHIIYAVGLTADSFYVSAAVTVTVEFSRGFSFVSTYHPGSQHVVGVTNFYNVLFVSEGDGGLEVLDITSRTLPRFRSRLVTGGQALHSDVLFPFVYVAELNRVEMADFQNVDSLITVSEYQLQSLKRSVAVSENFVFSAENDGLSILSQTRLQPFSRMSFTQDLLNYVVARHDTAFVVGNNALYIVDCSTPSAAHIVGSYGGLNLAKSVAVADTFAFIANGDAGVLALSIDNPANPRFLARYNPGQNFTSVAAGDGFLFAGSNSSQVHALIYSVPDSLIFFSGSDVSGLVQEIKYRSNYLYVAALSAVDIVRFVP